jgi:hypothetical protein
MRVFLSFAQSDAAAAAQLEEALRRGNIETWSTLDLGPGEDLRRVLDEESAKADGLLFLVGDGGFADPHLQREWRAFLRNDWALRKPLMPIVKVPGSFSGQVPPFLRNQKVIYTTNFDDAVERVEYLLQHPAEARDPERDAKGRADGVRRLEELKEFALALTSDSERGPGEPDSQ